MQNEAVTEKQHKLAQQCLNCPLCKRARKKQKGFFFWFVKKVESGFCPACKAYEKVYGRKAHEPTPNSGDTADSQLKV